MVAAAELIGSNVANSLSDQSDQFTLASVIGREVAEGVISYFHPEQDALQPQLIEALASSAPSGQDGEVNQHLSFMGLRALGFGINPQAIANPQIDLITLVDRNLFTNYFEDANFRYLSPENFIEDLIRLGSQELEKGKGSFGISHFVDEYVEWYKQIETSVAYRQKIKFLRWLIFRYTNIHE